MNARLVMEYVAGGTLRPRIPLPARDAERVAKQLCSALAYAHSRGVVHRDIKPENVLFDGEGRALLADFGIARLLLDDQAALTAPLVVLGTPRYMAPEARAGASADPRSDVFAVGVLLQEMLGVRAASPLGARLETIARRASATAPHERYRDAVELLQALDDGDRPSPPVASVLLAEQQSWLRAVALTAAGATCVSIYALLLSITPRTLHGHRSLACRSGGARRRKVCAPPLPPHARNLVRSELRALSSLRAMDAASSKLRALALHAVHR